MNIEQIKKDMDSGVLVTKATLEKLVEAAMIYEGAIKEIESGLEWPNDAELEATRSLAKVKDL